MRLGRCLRRPQPGRSPMLGLGPIRSAQCSRGAVRSLRAAPVALRRPAPPRRDGSPTTRRTPPIDERQRRRAPTTRTPTSAPSGPTSTARSRPIEQAAEAEARGRRSAARPGPASGRSPSAEDDHDAARTSDVGRAGEPPACRSSRRVPRAPMTTLDQGSRKPRTAIAAPTITNQPAISTNRAASSTSAGRRRRARPRSCSTPRVPIRRTRSRRSIAVGQAARPSRPTARVSAAGSRRPAPAIRLAEASGRPRQAVVRSRGRAAPPARRASAGVPVATVVEDPRRGRGRLERGGDGHGFGRARLGPTRPARARPPRARARRDRRGSGRRGDRLGARARRPPPPPRRRPRPPARGSGARRRFGSATSRFDRRVGAAVVAIAGSDTAVTRTGPRSAPATDASRAPQAGHDSRPYGTDSPQSMQSMVLVVIAAPRRPGRPGADRATASQTIRSARQSPGRRSVDPPNVPSRATSATVQTAARQAQTTRDEQPARPARATTNRATIARTAVTVGRAGRGRRRRPTRPTPRPPRRRSATSEQDDGRQPEADQVREWMPKARRDRAAERRPDAIAGQDDPPRGDGADDLADHPGEDDGDDDLGRLAAGRAWTIGVDDVERARQFAIGDEDDPDAARTRGPPRAG